MIAVVVAAAFSISSPAFTEGGNIPSKFTCDAGPTNPSPALAWKDAPAGTKSFVLIMDDPDAPMPGGFTHWVLADIPASTKRLPEGLRSAHYHFKLSALDVNTIGVAQGASRTDVEKAMTGHVLATTETVGLYQKQPK